MTLNNTWCFLLQYLTQNGYLQNNHLCFPFRNLLVSLLNCSRILSLLLPERSDRSLKTILLLNNTVFSLLSSVTQITWKFNGPWSSSSNVGEEQSVFVIYGGLRWPISATAKLTFPRQNLLFHGKTYFFTAKLTFPRQNLLFYGKTYLSTAKLTFSYFRLPVSLCLACRTGGLGGPARYTSTRAKREGRKIHL